MITETFEYDNQNRLLVHKHKVDNNTEEILAQNTYNELSQLSNKKVGGIDPSAPLQSIDYAYNIRGWLTKINDPANLNGKLFGYKVKYNEVEGLEIPNTDFATLKVKPKYNGNIAEVDWKTGTTTGDNLRRYGYVYDNLNRLSAGFYQKDTNPSAKEYFEKMDYDLNGNISNLKRSGALEGPVATNIDDLAYVYTGNRLTSVTDSSTDYRGYPDTSGNNIPYDVNGNMTSQKDKGILLIDYNFLNLPNYLKFNSGLSTRTGMINENTNYLYRSDGVKLRKTFNYAPYNPLGTITQLSSKITEYLDGFQYEGGGKKGTSTALVLKFIPTSEGYYNFENNKYIYNYTDHLGNVRVSYFKNGTSAEVLEENNYYPFGLKQEGYNALAGNPAYKYSYNGKELQTESGMYDYGARFYMADIGRWGVVDPLAENYNNMSVYNYGGNNPIYFTDPNGMNLDWYQDENGDMVFNNAVHEQGDLDKLGISGTYVGKTYQSENLNYAADGYVYDDSAEGGGKVIANGRISNIQEVTMYSAEAIVQKNINTSRSRLYEAIANYWGGYAYGISVGYTWGNSGYTLSLLQNFGTGQAKLFGTASTGLVKASYGVNFQLNALSAYGKNPDGSSNKDVFGGALGSSTEVSGSYIFGGAVSSSTEDGSLLPSPKGTIGTSINLGPSVGGGASKTYTTDLTPALNRFLKFNWLQHKSQFD